MIVENVIQVLRIPDAPNVYYHVGCYTWDGSEVVVCVYRLIHDVQCAGCHGMVSEMPGMMIQGAVKQLTLFDAA